LPSAEAFYSRVVAPAIVLISRQRVMRYMPYRLEQCIHPHVRCAWDPGSSPQVWSGNLPGVGTLLLVLCQARVCESCRATPLNRRGFLRDMSSGESTRTQAGDGAHLNLDGAAQSLPSVSFAAATTYKGEPSRLHSTRAIKRAAAPSPSEHLPSPPHFHISTPPPPHATWAEHSQPCASVTTEGAGEGAMARETRSGARLTTGCHLPAGRVVAGNCVSSNHRSSRE
jgi:hypothetical protein